MPPGRPGRRRSPTGPCRAASSGARWRGNAVRGKRGARARLGRAALGPGEPRARRKASQRAVALHSWLLRRPGVPPRRPPRRRRRALSAAAGLTAASTGPASTGPAHMEPGQYGPSRGASAAGKGPDPGAFPPRAGFSLRRCIPPGQFSAWNPRILARWTTVYGRPGPPANPGQRRLGRPWIAGAPEAAGTRAGKTGGTRSRTTSARALRRRGAYARRSLWPTPDYSALAVSDPGG